MSVDNDYDQLVEAYTRVVQTFNPEVIGTFVDVADDKEEAAESSMVPRAPRRNIARDRESAANRLWNDYFSPTPVFPADYFRRRFRMRKEMFIRICAGINAFNAMDPVPSYFEYFRLGPDATGRESFNILQKCTSAIRQLAYGYNADSLDEYLHMGQQTSYQCLDNFCKCVYHLYHIEYLRKPTQEDVNRLTVKHSEIHGFPGMLGSIDCMHWAWRNCPTAWHGQYTRGDKGHPTIMLEAVASYDLWIWHAYFGPAGSNNNINVLNEFDLFDDLLHDRAPQCHFSVAGRQFTKGYYLADGIYPEWATLVKSYKCPMEPQKIKFSRFQESARKDIERAFGVLQGRWKIIQQPARAYNINKIKRIMYTCVILHNMIVEDSGQQMSELEEDYLSNFQVPQRSWDERVAATLRIDGEIRDRRVHRDLRDALIQHIWNLPENYRQR